MGTITIINLTPHNLQPVPEVGKEYHVFDDGKIRPNRHYMVKIEEVVPFAEADQTLVDIWKDNVESCYWLFAPETDFFVRAKDEDEDNFYIGPEWFVRTIDGGWFSIEWFGGRLDADGHLYAAMVQEYGELSNG